MQMVKVVAASSSVTPLRGQDGWLVASLGRVSGAGGLRSYLLTV